MAKPFITIIGLGLTGTSLGLALQRNEPNFDVVGHDKSPEVAQAAKRANAVQRNEWNLHRACEGADLIVLAVPLDQVRAVMALIGEDLKAGTLLLAVGSLLQPMLDAAKAVLPNHQHLVVGRPVIAAVGSSPTPQADLFDQATFALATGATTDPAALELASNFATRLGAQSLFVDAQEHDGIMSGVEQMPQLLSAMVMLSSSRAAGWREAQRLAGRGFAAVTDATVNPSALAEAVRANRQSMLLRIDQLRSELVYWRDLIEKETADTPSQTLLNELSAAVEARITWEAQSQLKRWDLEPKPPASNEPRRGMLSQMFMGGLGGKRPTSNSGR